MTKIQQNLKDVFDRADDVDLREGRVAYTRYHDLMSRIADYYSVPLPGVVGAFAALSPNNDYIKNLRSAVTLCKAFREGVPYRNTVTTSYAKCGQKAWSVLHGTDFLDITAGLKTRAFYLNILEPDSPDFVTIDGHMSAISHGRYMRMSEAGLSVKRYKEIELDVKMIADDLGLIGSQVQAILWFTWKRIFKPVKNDGQLNLLDSEDNWRLNWEPQDIKPYPFRLLSEPVQLSLNFDIYQPELL